MPSQTCWQLALPLLCMDSMLILFNAFAELSQLRQGDEEPGDAFQVRAQLQSVLWCSGCIVRCVAAALLPGGWRVRPAPVVEVLEGLCQRDFVASRLLPTKSCTWQRLFHLAVGP